MADDTALMELQSGSYGQQAEIVKYAYWDQAVIAVATLQHRLFQVPVGGGVGKTLDQTNLKQSGQIPQAQRFKVHELRVLYTSAAAKGTAGVQDFYTLCRSTTVEFKLQNKDAHLQITLQELMGLSSAIAVTPTVAGDNIRIAQPRFSGIFTFGKQPVTLAAMTPFEVLITHHVAPGATTAGDILKISLGGVLTRAT